MKNRRTIITALLAFSLLCLSPVRAVGAEESQLKTKIKNTLYSL